MFLLLLLLPQVFCGPGDTVDQLRVAFTTVPFADQVFRAPVNIEEGAAPDWLSGSLARHACGVYGETGTESDMLNRVTHIFDCIEMGQGYSFHSGEVTFTSQFYDTNMVDIWRSYEENMNQSSVWWGTVFAKQNRTAMDREHDNMGKPGKPNVVPAVSWWLVGDDVLAMSEWPGGHKVDVHKMEALGGPGYQDNDFLGGFSNQHSPAHEQYGADGKIWSSAAVHKYEGDIGKNKRVIYTLDPDTMKREVVGEWTFADTNLTLCTGMGEVYPDPNGRLRQIHSLQVTENYVVVAETSYMYDPCVRKFWNDSQAGWEQEFKYEETVPGNVTIMDKNGTHVATIEVPPMMITHVLGSYEDQETKELHFDVLKYQDARAYTYFTYIDIILNGEPHPSNMTEVTRYTINMTNWTLKEIRNLVKTQVSPNSFEFTNINPAYQGKPYKYGYMTKNVFKLHGAVLKLNVEDGTIIEKELPDGLFPSEPIFVPHPDAVHEDDGVVLMSGIDGGREKGFLMVYNATTMDVILHATAPKLTLFGVHSKFFPFTVGCKENDCTPNETNSTTEGSTSNDSTTTNSTPGNSGNPIFNVSVLTILVFLILLVIQTM